MLNFIKALLISLLVTGSFNIRAMDKYMDSPELEMIASSFGLTVAEYLEQHRIQEAIFSAPQQKPIPGPKKVEVKSDPDLDRSLAASLGMTLSEFQKLKSEQESLQLANEMTIPKTQPDRITRTCLDDFAKERQYTEDRLLAQRLAAIALADERQSAKDRALAQRLAVKTPREGEYRLPFLKGKLSPEDRTKHQNATNASIAIKQDTNAHVIAQNFARSHFPTLQALEQKYLGIVQSHKALTLDEIDNIIQGLSNRNEAIGKIKPDIDTVMGKIREYWAAPIDSETGLNLQDVLSSTFIIARSYGDAALENLCITLADNTQTGGRCHPGVTGRLAYNYFIFVSLALEKQ